MTIVENRSIITGGVDTHGSFHVAGAVDANGGLLGVETFAVGHKHYAQLAKWLMSFGPIDKVGVEGTGCYGAGLARYLRGIGIAVVEVDRPNRQVRNRQGKSDHVDAVAAARAALSGSATGLPKHRDGKVEAIRVLMVARRSAVDERIILNQMRNICFCADDEIRIRFEGLSPKALINEASTMRPRAGDDLVRYTTLIVLRELARRARNLRDETNRLNKLLRPLVRDVAPDLLEIHGVASTPRQSCSSPPETTPNGCIPKPRGPISAASPPSPPRRAKPSSAIASTAAGTARRIQPSTP